MKKPQILEKCHDKSHNQGTNLIKNTGFNDFREIFSNLQEIIVQLKSCLREKYDNESWKVANFTDFR